MKKVSLAALMLASSLVVAACNDEQSTTNEEQDNATEQEAPVVDVPVETILTAIKEAFGEDYLPNMPLDETAVTEMFKLDFALVEQFVAEVPMISVHPDQVLIVKAKEGKIGDVVAQLEAARQHTIDHAITYPASLEKLQATKVVSKGDYAAYLMVGSAENMSEDPQERIDFAEAEVQKAVDAFHSAFQ